MISRGAGNTTSFLLVLIPMPGGDILLFWTHPGQLPPRTSRTSLIPTLAPDHPPFYPIFIFFSGSQSHQASSENPRQDFVYCIKNKVSNMDSLTRPEVCDNVEIIRKKEYFLGE
jgi:hypothetical protein